MKIFTPKNKSFFINRITCFFAALLFLPFFSYSTFHEEIVKLKTGTGEIEGSLMIPENKANMQVVLLIAGSGPTDRNGNQESMENNSLKLLAEALSAAGYASLRFDKRGIGASSMTGFSEIDLKIESFSDDVKQWIDLLYEDKRFNGIIVAGHSEGALLGLIASVNNKKVKGYISIAGAGRPIDVIILEQLSAAPDNVLKSISSIFEQLKKGDTLSNVPPALYALFRPSIQPFMISWLKYDPAREIKKLKIPVLIVQGTTDIQVKEKDANALSAANRGAKLLIVQNMNHVLKECETMDKTQQLKIYSDPLLPLHQQFVKETISFLDANFATKK